MSTPLQIIQSHISIRVVGLVIFTFTLSFPMFLIGQDHDLSLSTELIPDSLTKRSRAVVRYDETIVQLLDWDQYETKYDYAITILSKKGQTYLNFNAFYKEGSEKISDIKITYYNADGEVIKSVKGKEIEDYSALSGYELIGDSRRKNYNFEPNKYPVTVAFSYVKKSKNTMHLTSWRPLVDYRISVQSAHYRLVNSTSIPIEYHPRNFSKYPSIVESNVGYDMTNQVAISKESYCPSYYDIFPMLYTRPRTYSYEGIKGSHTTWDEFGKWMYAEFLRDKADLNIASAKSDLDGIIAGAKNVPDKVSAIYDYVQDQTRYVFIGLDEGGYAPLSAQKVHDVKYGDCKALSFYMKSLLDVFDIPSNYVIIHAKSSLPTDLFLEFPDTRPSNHVILNVPVDGDTLWVDCTSDDNPMNFLGRFTDDRLALEIRPDGASVIRTPVFSEEQNKKIIKSNVEVSETGDVTIQTTIVSQGLQIERGLYLQNLDQEDFEKYVKSDLLEDFDRVELGETDIALDESRVQFDEEYEFSASGHGQLAADYILLPYALFKIPIPNFKKDSKRDQEIFIARGYSYQFIDTYRFPDGYRWEVPEAEEQSSEFGAYKRLVEQLEDKLYRVTREFTLYKGRFPAERYNEIKRSLDSIKKLELGKLSITRKS